MLVCGEQPAAWVSISIKRHDNGMGACTMVLASELSIVSVQPVNLSCAVVIRRP